MGISLDLSRPATELTAALVDVWSVSGDEAELTDAVERALRAYPGLSVRRLGNVLVARTELGLDRRVVLAGHLDTVPVADNLPSRIADGRLHGCGSSDMKSGVALQLRAAHLIGSGELRPASDLSWIFYDCEEVEASRNGLNRLAAEQPELLRADLAILLEPTDSAVEGGCQGTMRAEITLAGRRAHSARSWLGVNAIHLAAPVLRRLADYQAREVAVDGLTYREGLNAVAITGGVAGNVVPDRCTVTVNFRFAPDLDEASCRGAPALGVRRLRAGGGRLRAVGQAGPGSAAGAAGGGRSRRRQGRGQARLDGRGPVRRARHSRAELQPGRSEPGTPGGRVGGSGRHRAV